MTSSATTDDRIDGLLAHIYGENLDPHVHRGFADLIDRHRHGRPAPRRRPVAWLIAYPDHVTDDDAPLAMLGRALDDLLPERLEGVHVLPCYPSSSDEGFAVMDYLTVDPAVGTWADIEELAVGRHVMLDAVINHASAQGNWFEAWRRGDDAYAGFFRTEDPDNDLSAVVRARTHPLLTPFDTAGGRQWVWTTFSADQVDLDYRNPAVTLAVAEVLLTYASHGASAIRLDAIGFLWKEAGSPSIHLDETHRVIQLLRAVLDRTYPDVVLVSETNVPHAENVSYLGDGTAREADMVYQFPLPPLTLHAFTSGDARPLKAWLTTIGGIPDHTTYFNFLASHDGVGLRPLEGLVGAGEVDRLVDVCVGNGGLVNHRSGPTGDRIPYELNATWFDLIRGRQEGDDALARHVASHGLMLALRGEPAVYLQGLLAERNATDLAAASGSARSINRRRFRYDDLAARLGDHASRAAQSVAAIKAMLDWRASTAAFHPLAPQRVLETPQEVVGIERRSEGGDVAEVYVNVSPATIPIDGVRSGTVDGFRIADEAPGRLVLDPWGLAYVIDGTR